MYVNTCSEQVKVSLGIASKHCYERGLSTVNLSTPFLSNKKH